MKNFKNFYIATIATIVILTIFGNYPLGKIEKILWERKSNKANVEREISEQWGGSYYFGRVALKIPYTYEYDVEKTRKVKTKDKEVYEHNYKVTKVTTNSSTFGASTMDVTSQSNVQERYRGIYKVPIFTSETSAKVVFPKVNYKLLHKRLKKVLYEEAEITVGLKQGKELVDFSVSLNGQSIKPKSREGELVIPVNLNQLKLPIEMDLQFNYNGTKEISFEPTAERSTFVLSSNWKDPKFSGDRLPSEREVTPEGFTARWSVMGFSEEGNAFANRKAFGVKLINVLDIYKQNTRSMKYGTLFVFLTFIGFFIIQMVRGVRIHPIQYTFIMASMVEFYFLLLSMSEHMSFQLSFAIASVATIATIGLYSVRLLKSAKWSLFIVGELSMLYVFLFMTVASADYALLIGSIGLFIILAVAMYATRNVKWDAMDERVKQEIIPKNPAPSVS